MEDKNMLELSPSKKIQSEEVFKYKVRLYYYTSITPEYNDNAYEERIYEMYPENDDLTKYNIMIPYNEHEYNQIDRCLKASGAVFVELWFMQEDKIVNRFWLDKAEVVSEGSVDRMWLKMKEISSLKQKRQPDS